MAYHKVIVLWLAIDNLPLEYPTVSDKKLKQRCDKTKIWILHEPIFLVLIQIFIVDYGCQLLKKSQSKQR